MRKKHPSGLTASERAMYARLKKGPAALFSLAHAARCTSGSVKAILSRLRRKIPADETIPRASRFSPTYRLETKAGKTDKGSKPRNNMLWPKNFLPDYTLCEWFRYSWYRTYHLACATLLRTRPLAVSNRGQHGLPVPPSLFHKEMA